MAFPTISTSQENIHPGSMNRSYSETSQSEQYPDQESLVLYCVRSTPVHSTQLSQEPPLRLRRPSFKIGLPRRTSSMESCGLRVVTPPQADASQKLDFPFMELEEPTLPQFRRPFHLTPPEELHISPLETAFVSDSITPTDLALGHSQSENTSPVSNVGHDDPAAGDMDETPDDEDENDSPLDLDKLLTYVLDRLAEVPMPAMSISVVNQPLPFPLPLRITSQPYPDFTLFPQLVERLRHEPRISATGIRASHILSDKLPSENHPSSPPVTPSYLARNSQQGYFSSKPLFSSISASPGLAVPPGEAMLSITERIIPPSSEFEISSFLCDATDSGFRERLSELAPGGLFITILPTAKGGETFHNLYLSKILDPILRNMIVRLGLHTDLARDISNTTALNQLLSFPPMKSKVLSLLSSTSNLPLSTTNLRFELISSTRGTISLPFQIWYSWWLGQERSRIMGLLNYHLNVQGQGVISGVTRSSIMLEIEDKMRTAGLGQSVDRGIEVGVFVVQRTM